MPFVYSDESRFGSSDEFCGVGFLITYDDIPNAVIQPASKNSAKTENAFAQTARTKTTTR